MLLKSSEINDYSWIINALLESPFCSRSCCQTCFPSIVRPMNGLCEWILKNFLICSRNEPLHLFLVVLSVSDEEDELLSSKLRTQRENVSLVQYRSNSFSQWNDSRWRASKFSSLWFCFCLWSTHKIFRIQLWRIFFELIFWHFCVIVQIHHELIWTMRILTQEWVLSLLKNIILTWTPCLPCK